MYLNNLLPKSLVMILLLAITVITGCEEEELAREKFIASYTVTENCTSGTFTYNMNIVNSSSSEDKIILQNLYGLPTQVNVTATVSGSNISFSETVNGVNYSGTGSISGNTLTINYSASANGQTDNCSLTAIKQ